MPPFPSPQNNFNNVSHPVGRGINAPVDDQGHTLLHLAIERNDAPAALRLLKLDANPNQVDDNGRPPLFAAIAAQNLDIIRALLARGASFRTEDDGGRTPAMWAVEQNVSPAFLDALVETGMSLDYVGRTGRTALHAAAAANNESAIDYLVQHGLSVDAVDQDGKTPLHAAAERGAAFALTRLIAAGANPLVRNREIKTPLHIAASRGDDASVDVLLALPEVRRSLNDHQTYAEGWTPLMAAVANNRVSVAKKLLYFGADVNQRDNRNRHSLFLAVERGYAEMAALLIRNGADVVKAPRLENGQSLLQSIHISHYQEILVELCKAGADVNEKDSNGQTALYKAADIKDAKKVRALLELGADPDLPNEAGRRPLDAAVVAYSSYSSYGEDTSSGAVIETVSALLAAGANPNLASSGAVSVAPLHVAARNGRTEVVKMLLEHGAVVDEVERSTGATAWLNAVSNRNLGAADLLVKAGADTTRKDKNGRSVLHLAAQSGAKDMLEYFLKIPAMRAEVSTPDTTGATPLHNAVRYQKMDCIRVLLAAGANAAAPDSQGVTPLHLAAGNYNDAALLALIAVLGKKADWNAQTKVDKETPLHIAARLGYRNIVDQLLKLDADVTLRDARGLTPLMMAVNSEQYPAISAIVAHMKAKGLSLNETRDARGRTALHVAASRWASTAAALLVESGADINARTPDGDTALHIAAREGRTEIVRYLAARGADCHLANAAGMTALDIALDANRTDLADLIREAQRKQPAPPANKQDNKPPSGPPPRGSFLKPKRPPFHP